MAGIESILAVEFDKYAAFTYQKNHKNTKVYGVDMNSSATGKYFADYFQTVPNGKSKNFINQIIKICRRFKINLVRHNLYAEPEQLNLVRNENVHP